MDNHLVVIYTAALEQCREFYSALGLELTREQHGHGPVHYAAVLPHLVLELYPPKDGQTTGPLRLALHLEATPNHPPAQRQLKDPDGRTISTTWT